MERFLFLLKKMIPRRVFRALQPHYHFVLNACAALVYRFPSRRLTVVGVTGTTGKTTSVFLLAHLLRAHGLRVGYTSTALLSDGTRDWLNDKKMTMLGRFFTQRMLARMVRAGCDVAIVETTSEGIAQYRHRFINYDVLLFTGLYPEHIESHGSFAAYKAAKLRLFTHLRRCAPKPGGVPKTIVVNGDDEHARDFLAPWAQRKVCFTTRTNCAAAPDTAVHHYVSGGVTDAGLVITFDGTLIQTPLIGTFNAANVAGALAVARALDVPLERLARAAQTLPDVPGRLERISVPQRGFQVIVDYAFEPVAMTRLYETVAHLHPRRVIHVLGGTGGGRDRARRPKLGTIAGTHAAIVIITDEDPYDEDPRAIMEDVAAGARAAGKKDGTDLFVITERAAAIRHALDMAQRGDIVLITGKGSEQAICVAGGRRIPHDDRAVVKNALGV